jgi:hypothetical protein
MFTDSVVVFEAYFGLEIAQWGSENSEVDG